MAQHRERDTGREQFWRRMVRLWRRSRPMTVRDFCAEHGLSEPSFYGWRRTLTQRDRGAQLKTACKPSKCRQRVGQQHTARFVPLQIVPAPVGSTAVLEVVLSSGRIVRVPPGFDAATLRQLLAIVEDRPC